MKLYIRQKVFSWGDKFTVRDGNDCDRYRVEGEVFSLGHRLHIYDSQDTEAAVIRQKVMSFLPRYFIFRAGETVELAMRLSFLTSHYRFSGRPWSLEGNFSGHEYRLQDDTTGETVMTVGKEWFTWGDSYALDIADGADEVLCLAVLIAVDCVRADQSRR